MRARSAAEAAAPRLAAAGVPDAKFEAELLTREAAGVSRTSYYTGAVLDRDSADRLENWLARREQREPAPYITGHKEFYGREFRVGSGVLVPRPETELLVELALRELDARPEALVVEAGTGSGAVAVSLAGERPGAGVAATEIDAKALAFAAVNARRWAPHLPLIRCDLLSAIARADIVLANLPYIPTWEIEALEPEVSRWEPKVALDGGDDGFGLIRRLVADCAERLRPSFLALEVGFGQANTLAEILKDAGVEPWFEKDLAGIDRVVCARWG